MPNEPAWRLKVREAHAAHMAAVQAIDLAFPEKSRWVYDKAVVEVTPSGADVADLGMIRVQLVDPPFWSRSVAAGCLKPIPEVEMKDLPKTVRIKSGSEAGAVVVVHFVNPSGNLDCRFAEDFGPHRKGEIIVVDPSNVMPQEEGRCENATNSPTPSPA